MVGTTYYAMTAGGTRPAIGAPNLKSQLLALEPWTASFAVPRQPCFYSIVTLPFIIHEHGARQGSSHCRLRQLRRSVSHILVHSFSLYSHM